MEYRQPLKAGRGKERYCPLVPLEEMQPTPLDFALKSLILDF